jgi:hypothetical protein
MSAGVRRGKAGVRSSSALFPVICLLLLPLIVAVLTVAFLGYAGWLAAYLLWQFTYPRCRRIRLGRLLRPGNDATT